MKITTKQITTTAVLLAICIVSQFFKNTSVYITGPIINACLIMPTAALAAESTVTIESQTNSAFDYLEYYKDGSWHDLNTPRHVIEQTGEICYCIEHSEGNPHGDTYTAASPSSVFSTNTLAGVQAIMMYGYP